MTAGFLSLFTTWLTCLTMVTHTPLLVSAQVDEPRLETPIFPNGVKSLFIGNSLFIPMAKQFNHFAKSKNSHSYKEYPDHNFTDYMKPGSSGAPHEIWNNNKEDVKALLKGQNVGLFGMHIGYYYNEKRDTWVAPLENIIHSYKRWINLVLSYNPNTSIFIGMPWPNQPGSYGATAYMNKIQKVGDATYNNVIKKLRKKYPATNIYFLNYGSLGGEMNLMFKQGDLVDIDTKFLNPTDPTNTKENSLFSDQTGHPGYMLKELTGLAWLNWLYTGQNFTTFDQTAKDEYNLEWDEQNMKDVYQVVEQMNQDYRL